MYRDIFRKLNIHIQFEKVNKNFDGKVVFTSKMVTTNLSVLHIYNI